MAKISLQQFAGHYTVSTFTALATGAVATYTANNTLGYSVAYDDTLPIAWLTFVGLPSTVYASAKLAKMLGKKTVATVTASTRKPVHGRAIPIHGGDSGHIFLNTVGSLFATSAPGPRVPGPRATVPQLPDVFTVTGVTWSDTMDAMTIEFSETEVRAFLDAVWRRQTSDSQARHYPFSRSYFIKKHRPRLNFGEYYGLLALCDMAGIVANRSKGKSGKLLLQPSQALRQIKYTFA